MKTINWLNHQQRLVQAYNNGLEFALVNEKMEQIQPLCFCKDYLQDAIWGSVNQKKIQVFGMIWEPGMPEFDPETTRTLVCFKNSDLGKRIEAMEVFIHAIEDELGLSKSIIYQVENPLDKYKDNAFLYEGTKLWQVASPMISGYTQFIRASQIHDKSRSVEATLDIVSTYSGADKIIQGSDKSRVVQLKQFISHFKDHTVEETFGLDYKLNYPVSTESAPYAIHNAGFLYYMSGGKFANHWIDPKPRTEAKVGS